MQLARIVSEQEIRVTLIQDELDRRFRVADTVNVLRHDTLKELVLSGQHAAEKAVQAALVSSKEAVEKAQVASEMRFASVNEFRAQQTELIRQFPTRLEVEAKVDALATTIRRNEQEIREQKTLQNGNIYVWLTVLSVIIAVTAVIVSIVVHVH